MSAPVLDPAHRLRLPNGTHGGVSGGGDDDDDSTPCLQRMTSTMTVKDMNAMMTRRQNAVHRHRDSAWGRCTMAFPTRDAIRPVACAHFSPNTALGHGE